MAGTKINEASDKELSERFAIIYWMIGLRPQHFPTEEQSLMIFNYIRNNFGNRFVNELVFAFDKAINNLLDIDDVKVYDQFTLEYFVRIFNSYRKWSYCILKENEKPIEYKSLPMPETTEIEMQSEINEYLNKELNINYLPPYLYDYAEKLNLIKLSKQEKIAIFDKAKLFRKHQLREIAENYRKEDIVDYNNFCHKLDTGFKKDDIELFNLKNLAKKIAFIDYAKNYNSSKVKS